MELKDKNKNIAFWQQWLQKYKSFKCLWDPSFESTENELLIAWNELIKLAKSVKKNASAVYVQCRLQKFFYQYKLEAKKVDVAAANGIRYEPESFYYKIFESIQVSRQIGKRHKEEELVNTKRSEESKYQNQQFWRKVIEKFVSSKCLWDYKNRKLYKKSVQEKAYDELLTMIKPIHPWADLQFVKQRISSFRNCFRREKRRVLNEQKNGIDYKPTLFYYDLLAPLYEADESNVEEKNALIVEKSPKISNTEKFKKFRFLKSVPKVKKYACEQAASTFALDPESRLWSKVIKRYVSNFKCLWDQDNKKLYTRNERLEAYNELVKIVKPFYPNANVAFLKRKLNALRTSYRREKKRLSKEKANGNDYNTRLYYFHLLTPIYQKNSIVVNISSGEDDDEADKMELNNCSNLKIHLPESSQEKNLWSKVIKKYVSFKCLWYHKKIYSKPERLKAWIELLKMVKVFKPDANLEYVKKRFYGFRINYRRELRRIYKAKEQGIDLTSSLFYFNLLTPIYQSNCEPMEYTSEEEHNEYLSKIATTVENEVRAELVKKISEKNNLSECSMDNDLWRNFIKKYIAFKCLWDHKKLYTKEERLSAWLSLLKFVRGSYPEADLAYIKTRIGIFRTVFKKEKKKILTAAKNGIQLKSKVFYYDLISSVYENDGTIAMEDSNDESANDCETRFTKIVQLNKKDNLKNLALKKELQDLGFICGPFETENLSHYKKVWLKILKKYVNFKCLWDLRNREIYKDYEREAAWHELLIMFHTIIAEADLAVLKKRLQSMRSNYCKIYQKAKEAKENGFEPEISLYYFNAISPIYQEGFPLLMDDNDDEDPLRDQPTLNPKFTTYFPDDDDEEDESNNFDKGQYHFEPVAVDRFEAEEHSVSQISLGQNESFQTISDDQAEQYIVDELCEERELILPTAVVESSANARNDNDVQIKTTIKQNTKQKSKRTLNCDDDNIICCKTSRFDELQTFEIKIDQHLERMKNEQYLLAEKLITDVCLYGRLGKLTIASGVKLRNK